MKIYHFKKIIDMETKEIKKIRVSSLGDILLKGGVETFRIMKGIITPEQNEHMLRGTYAEPFVKKMYKELYGNHITSEQLRLENELFVGHIDGIARDRSGIERLLEIKTTIKMPSVIPNSYMLQVQTYMGLLREYSYNINTCVLLYCDGWWKLKEFFVDYDPELYEIIKTKAEEWYNNYYLKDIEPQPIELIKPNITINDDDEYDEIVARYNELSAEISELEKEKEEIKEKLLAKGSYTTRRYFVEIKQSKQLRVDTKLLEKSGFDLTPFKKEIIINRINIKEL
jgi:predicted phage-related endonuclease